MRPIYVLLFTLFLSSTLLAQYEPMDIPLLKNGNTLRNAWAGGMNLPQFSEVDLNNDGIQDLVVFDREGTIGTTFINHGTPGQVDYHYAPDYMKRLPQDCVNFMLMRDYNCDGIEDIFGMYVVWGQGVGVAVWKGSYDANDTIQFTLVKDQLKYDAGAAFPFKMFVYNTDLPSVDDIDGDGDLDILSFTLDICFPKNIFWYKNMSVENGHGCDSLDFRLESECWGLFEETGDSSIVNFSPSTDSCVKNPWFNQRLAMRPPNKFDGHTDAKNGRHVGSNVTTIDYNGDGVRDMTLGAVTFKNVNMVSGIEINDTILITTQDYHFPSYDVPVDIFTFVSTYFLDVNNDGKTDMINCPSEMGIGEAVLDSVAWYYQNTTSNSNMIFNFQQKDFLVGEMLDIGHRAFPALFDYNGDGKLDILLGSFGRPKVGGSYNYGMTLLENKGTLSNPSFEFVTDNYAGLDVLQLNGLHPTFGDLDGDNDLDMICGAQDGTLIYLENTAGSGNPATWAPPVSNFSGIDVGDAAAPFLVDLDRDSDLDLVVGQFAGGIHYFENGGTPSAHSFTNTAATTNLGGYNVQAANSRNSMPFIHDNAGAYEMFIGHQQGNIIHLGNIDADIMGVYDTLSQSFNNFYQGKYTDIAITDIDNDGKLDYVLGTGRGGLMIMTEKDTLTAIQTVNIEQKVIQIFPNPADEALTISLLVSNPTQLHLTVYNALGQVILQETKSAGAQQYHLDITKLAAGVHFMEVKTDTHSETHRFVKR